ncbi:hypothetical protein D3806_20270 [Salmonella enterica subsp. enterica]|nr:hypothetical protein [Salmonella enterica subsp. enterica]
MFIMYTDRLQSHDQGTIIGVSIYKSSSYLPVAPNNWNEKKAALLRRFFFVFGWAGLCVHRYSYPRLGYPLQQLIRF